MNLRAGSLSLLGAAFLLGCRCVWADAVADVDATTQQWVAAFNRKSAADLVALYAPDAILFGTSSPVLRDTPDKVRDYFKSIADLGDATITLGEHRVQVFGAVAVSTGFYTRSSSQSGAVVKNPARFTFVYQHRAGKWVIVTHHSSAVP
jgi:hypothetical protein